MPWLKRPPLYAGGEAARTDDGTWRVRSWFTWPDGTAGEDETEPGSRLDCERWLACAAAGTPMAVSDPATSRIHHVQIQRAILEAVA